MTLQEADNERPVGLLQYLAATSGKHTGKGVRYKCEKENLQVCIMMKCV